MITSFKLFENIETPPEIGDYIIIDNNLYKDSYRPFYDFISSNIGQVINIKIGQGGSFTGFSNEKLLIVKFQNVPEDLSFGRKNFFKNGIRNCSVSSLKCWSSNKEELEILLKSNKYNL